MNGERQNYSIFLTPAPEDFAYLQNLIRELSTKYDAEPFEPHVTVYAGSFEGHDVLEAALRASVFPMNPFSLVTQGIGFTEEYFKTLFIDFEESPVLRGIYERIRDQIPHDSGYVLTPHLSLLYQDMPLSEKEAAAGMVRLERQSFLFDELRLVTPGGRGVGWRDTRRWKTLGRVTLC